jgi:cytochrome c oxidase assembly protein subunit 15
MAFAQLVLGAVIRHLPLGASPGVFRAALLLHLVVAGALTVQIGFASWKAWRVGEGRGLAIPSLALPNLLALQLALGGATYVVKYSWPAWFGDYSFAATYVVQEKSLIQSLITTAHVANGSLILFVSVFLAMRAARLHAHAWGVERAEPGPACQRSAEEPPNQLRILTAA